MKDIRKHKKLMSQLNEMLADSEALKIELANKQREYQQKLTAIKGLKSELEKLNASNDLKVSEHAIVRYFERVKGFDLQEVEKEILSEKVLDLVEKLGGSGTYPNDGYSIVMKNFTVTTIV